MKTRTAKAIAKYRIKKLEIRNRKIRKNEEIRLAYIILGGTT